jgi:hypothetical protein
VVRAVGHARNGVCDFGEATRRTDNVIQNMWEVTRVDVRTQYAKILAPEQLVVLPGRSNQLYQANRPLHIRIFVQWDAHPCPQAQTWVAMSAQVWCDDL